MGKFASCCLLSYERPDFLRDAVLTLVGNAHYPLELIVHDDGSRDPAVRSMLREFVDAGAISTVIENPPGHNQGVGVAMNRMFEIAQGDPIIKLDQDLIFGPGWLSQVIDILDYNRRHAWGEDGQRGIAAMGLFRYDHDPVDHRKMFLADWGVWHEVDDFVGSAMVVQREAWEDIGPFPQHSDEFAEDKHWKDLAKTEDWALALPPRNLAVNRGFGPPHSTVVEQDGDGVKVASIHHGPKLIKAAA